MASTTSAVRSHTQVLYLNLDASDAPQIARFLTRHPTTLGHFVYVDCRQLRNFKQYGYCHVISQLLQLRATGCYLCLHNVDRCFYQTLRLLQLIPLFEIRLRSRLSIQAPACPN